MGVDDYVIKLFNLFEIMVWVKLLLWCFENNVMIIEFDILDIGLLMINKDLYEVKMLMGKDI